MKLKFIRAVYTAGVALYSDPIVVESEYTGEIVEGIIAAIRKDPDHALTYPEGQIRNTHRYIVEIDGTSVRINPSEDLPARLTDPTWLGQLVNYCREGVFQQAPEFRAAEETTWAITGPSFQDRYFVIIPDQVENGQFDTRKEAEDTRKLWLDQRFNVRRAEYVRRAAQACVQYPEQDLARLVLSDLALQYPDMQRNPSA